jgi:hypothetical protein
VNVRLIFLYVRFSHEHALGSIAADAAVLTAATSAWSFSWAIFTACFGATSVVESATTGVVELASLLSTGSIVQKQTVGCFVEGSMVRIPSVSTKNRIGIPGIHGICACLQGILRM